MKMRGDRDSQRSRVYSAERAAMPEQPPMSIEECAAFVADIQRRPWFRTRWGDRTITVVATNGRGGRVYRRDGHIRLGVWARQPWVILHELAHSLTASDVGHGPEFVGVFLFLVRQVMGREAGARLLAECRTHRVRRSNRAIPKPTRTAATVTAQRAQQRAADRAPLTTSEWQTLARLLERAIKSDALGATGTAGRTRAMAVRREAASRGPLEAQPGPAGAVRIGRRGRG